jgi:enoyl-CoA hydratase/3-hydroxyacyl-CoA dehydrogenase
MGTAAYANPLLEPATGPPPRRVAVIGAGTIGPDIGYYLKSALPALELVLIDLKAEAIDSALARLHGYAEKAVARGKMKPRQAEAVLANISSSTDYAALAGADWVIEAATEDLALKRRIFAAVEERVGAEALITSNTSSLPAARLFAELAHPERATVTHFFAPAWRNPVVEVIDWPRLDRAQLAALRYLFATTGKLPLTTADAPCFMLDRIFDNWCNEAALLLGQASAAQIDTVAQAHVHAGPFFVLNLAHGNPIIVETNTLQSAEEGAHYTPAPIFNSVERWATVAPGQRAEVVADLAKSIDDRLRGVLWSQAVDIIDRGIGERADLDIGCRLALGFRHGPLESMRDAGEAEVRRVLERFVGDRPGMPRPRRAIAAYQPPARHVVVDRLDLAGSGVVVITLRRPEALNALHDEMTDEILAVIRRHQAEAAVAGFVLTGWGTKAFCAGADIGRFPSMLGDAPAAVRYARDCARLLVHLDRIEKPVVAAIHGLALGGGFELAMRCHALVAERVATFQLPEVTLGILPALGAMVVPMRRWPQAAQTFHRMLTRGERLSAGNALELGVVDALADDPSAVFELALRKVHELAKHGIPRLREGSVDSMIELPAPEPQPGTRPLSAEVVALIDRAVRDAARADTLAGALEVGYRAFGEVACTAAAREGIQAFLEHRRADFSRTG